MSPELRDNIIKMAWSDRVTFEDIEKKTGFNEAKVIKVMRSSLKPSSFRCWRKRVSGRITKHSKLFRTRQSIGEKKSYSISELDEDDLQDSHL